MNQTIVQRSAPITGHLRVTIENSNGDIAIEAVDGLTEATAELRCDKAVDLEPFAPAFGDVSLNGAFALGSAQDRQWRRLSRHGCPSASDHR